MRLPLYWIAACLVASASWVGACPPPIPGLTEAQRLKPGFDAATDIVYGVVVKGAHSRQKARFKIIHVYKGALTPGTVIEAVPDYGFDAQCLGMIQPPPPSAAKGDYGVVAFNGRSPALTFIDPWTLRVAFKEGWIQSARQ
jgi:hypothetical protein